MHIFLRSLLVVAALLRYMHATCVMEVFRCMKKFVVQVYKARMHAAVVNNYAPDITQTSGFRDLPVAVKVGFVFFSDVDSLVQWLFRFRSPIRTFFH